MEQFQHVLLNVWQEACRHIDISQSTANIAAMLVRHIPIEQVLVRRIDRPAIVPGNRGRRAGRPAAIACPTPGPIARRPNWNRCLDWCRRGKVAHRHGRPAARRGVGSARAGRLEGDVLAGPLGDPAGHCGVLVFLAPADRAFDREHAELAQLLLGAVLRGVGKRPAAAGDGRLARGGRGRQTLAADAAGTQDAGRYDRRRRVGAPRGHGAGGAGRPLRRPRADLRRDGHGQGVGRPGDPQPLVARATARSIRVNCGAIPPELIDSQLFGHERGAFTGAVETRRGWFERADGGTLFLDEIGELPPAAQVRMLRILQDGWMERVGGEKPINVDVRIVAATHRDLASMVAEGRFREDLWYRIAVFPIVLPPLRERREDIARLAAHFAERAATRFGLAPVAPTPEDLALLTSYPWPGNVRELATVIDRAAILGDGKRLEVAKALGVGADRRRSRRPAAAPRALERQCSPPAQPRSAGRRRSSRWTRPCAGTSRRRWPSRTDASRAAKAPPRCCRSIRTRCGRRCASWASTGPASATPVSRRPGLIL